MFPLLNHLTEIVSHGGKGTHGEIYPKAAQKLMSLIGGTSESLEGRRSATCFGKIQAQSY